MSKLPSNNTYRTQTNPQITVTPLYDAFGKPIIQPTQPTYMQEKPIIETTQPMQTTQTSTHHENSKAPTGSESIHYRETPHSFVLQQKSSYHDPVSGISQKIKSVSQGRQHDTTRNRSSSSERKRKQNENNTSSFTSNQPISNPTITYQKTPILNSTNTYTQPLISTIGYNQQPISTMEYTQPPISNPQMNYNINQTVSYAQPINENQRSDISYQRMPACSTNIQNEKKDQSIKIPFLMHDSNKLQAVEEGTIKNTSSGVKTSQKLNYVDPKTGYEESVYIKTKVRGDKSKNGSKGKSQTTYMHKVQETPEGTKVQIKQKHRQGGIMENIKNKIHNMFNK